MASLASARRCALHARLQSIGLSTSTPLALEVAGTATGIDPRMLDLWAAVRASQALAAELQVGPLISRLPPRPRGCRRAARRADLAAQRPDRVLSVVAELHGEGELELQEPLAQSTRVPVQLIERAMRCRCARRAPASRDAEWSDLAVLPRQRALRAARADRSRHGRAVLENSLTAGAFNAGRIEILRVLASQAAVSLQNAHLLEEQAEKDHLRREMETAARIQQALVPTAPQIAGCEIAVHMTPADQVGGDYYDVMRAGGCDWFVVGDVCGHGLPAGLIMVICQTALHTVLHGQPDINPAQALAQVNHVLKESLERFHESKYVAITLFRHPGEGAFEFAGLHEDLVILPARESDRRGAAHRGHVAGRRARHRAAHPGAPSTARAERRARAVHRRRHRRARARRHDVGRAGLERLLGECGRLPLDDQGPHPQRAVELPKATTSRCLCSAARPGERRQPAARPFPYTAGTEVWIALRFGVVGP